MLVVSHIFGHGFDRRRISKLEEFGFRLRPEARSFSGAQICRFIDFVEGPSLEIIEVADAEIYLESIPKGMIPYCPGISLVVTPESSATIREYSDDFHHFEPYPLHENYDASTTGDGPGWNYLNFAKPVVTGTFVWLTFFDEPKPRRYRDCFKSHPNTAQRVSDIVFDLDLRSLHGLSRLAGMKIKEGHLRIGSVDVWPGASIEGLPISGDKSFPLVAVVLNASSLAHFSSMDAVTEVSFMSRPAVRITTNPSSWDLLIKA